MDFIDDDLLDSDSSAIDEGELYTEDNYEDNYQNVKETFLKKRKTNNISDSSNKMFSIENKKSINNKIGLEDCLSHEFYDDDEIFSDDLCDYDPKELEEFHTPLSKIN